MPLLTPGLGRLSGRMPGRYGPDPDLGWHRAAQRLSPGVNPFLLPATNFLRARRSHQLFVTNTVILLRIGVKLCRLWVKMQTAQ